MTVKLSELTISNNFMFGAVMLDAENCRQFLEITLDFPIERVVVDLEESIFYHPEYKGVRLDVYAKDEKNTHYNVEMQVAQKPSLARRARYYHSQMDMKLLASGLEYTKLPDAFVIFICDYDPFQQKKYRYTCVNQCRETGDIIEDGSVTVFLSTHGENDDEVPESLVKFLKFVKADLNGSRADYEDDFVKRLQDSIENIKADREMGVRYMLLEELLQDERVAAEAKGKAIGKAEYVLDLLEDLGSVPADLSVLITNECNLETLGRYHKLAARAKSIEDFQEAIK